MTRMLTSLRLFRVLALLATAALGTGLLMLVGIESAEAAFPGQNGKIAFVSGRDGYSEIYAANADGIGETNLTNTPASGEDFPKYSADGKKMVFRGPGEGLYNDLYTMNADGSNKIRITNEESFKRDLIWSPDGTKIAFVGCCTGGHAIYTMNTDGSNQTNISKNPAFDGSPDWQPITAATTNTAPTITDVRPRPGSSKTDPTPVVAATVKDQQTDLAKANITLAIDGQTIPQAAFSYNRSTDRMSYTPPTDLSLGRHNIRVTAKDEAGMTGTKSWNFYIVQG